MCIIPKYVKLLGIHIDHKLSFDEHVSSLCKKREISLMPYQPKKIQEGVLKILYNDFESNYESYLKKSGKCMMGVKRRQSLGLEIFYDSPENESCFYGRPIL